MRSVIFHENQATRLAVLGVVLLYVCCSMYHIESEIAKRDPYCMCVEEYVILNLKIAKETLCDDVILIVQWTLAPLSTDKAIQL